MQRYNFAFEENSKIGLAVSQLLVPERHCEGSMTEAISQKIWVNR
jgi:hypothetical protein